MKFLNNDIQPLGMGCWPIGGPMYAADGTSLGYSNSNDDESIKTIHAALANGITVFDTAAAYGAGHSECLLAKALKHHPEAIVITKIGLDINETDKTILGERFEPESILPAVEGCLRRLDKDTIDLVLLHPNEVPVSSADLVFQEMDKAIEQGKIRSYGWSTDITDNINRTHQSANFQAVEFAMNVLMDAPKMQEIVDANQLYALIRSPLAMGLLSGKYSKASELPENDVRSSNPGWAKYYIDGKPNEEFLHRMDAVKELLQVGGRTLVQGALGWLWGRSVTNIPVPGARTVRQVEGLAAALHTGSLPEDVMLEIEALIGGKNMSLGDEPR